MSYKANELYVVTVAKAISINNERSITNYKQKRKFYVAKLEKVEKKGCTYKLMSKDVLVYDKYNIASSIGSYYINYIEALNLATGQYKKSEYTYDEIINAEKKINLDREFTK